MQFEILKRAVWCVGWFCLCCVPGLSDEPVAVSSVDPKSGSIRIAMQRKGGDASFRGIAVRSQREAWVSGSGSTVLKTMDAGESWQVVDVGGGTELDFRDIALPRPGVVLLMSAGPGEKSRVFRSADGGVSWTDVLSNRDPKGFFNTMTFVDSNRGVLIGDPIDGKVDLYRTDDGGVTWRRGRGPDVIDGEYFFAASGTNVASVGADKTGGEDRWWIATGGATARVFRSSDGGENWLATNTPMAQGNESSGIFSIAFRDRLHGVVVGGDYKNPDETHQDVGRSNAATTKDGGLTWERTKDGGMFFHKACVRHLTGTTWIAAGRTGIAVSKDDGMTWKQISDESFYTFDLVPGATRGWLAGKDGRVAQFDFEP